MVVFAYYDADADIAWFPTGESDDVVSERVPDGLREYDRTTRRLVAIEVWDASTSLPRTLLEALPSLAAPQSAAAELVPGTRPGKRLQDVARDLLRQWFDAVWSFVGVGLSQSQSIRAMHTSSYHSARSCTPRTSTPS
jgi:hypothetical protein